MSKRKGKQQMQAAHHIASAKVLNPDRIRVPDLKRVGAETVYREDRINVVVSLRDDPLGHMRYRGESDKRLGEAQYQAGRKWQAIYEDAGVGRVRSSGDIREPVDCGGIVSDGITDRQIRAHKLLDRWDSLLGEEGYRLVRHVLADKATLRQAALRFYGGAAPANIKYAGRRFRECLSTLARDMGLA